MTVHLFLLVQRQSRYVNKAHMQSPYLPEAATSAMSFFVTCDMKPTIEKITKPANMLVHELMQHTMIESLGRGNIKKNGPVVKDFVLYP